MSRTFYTGLALAALAFVLAACAPPGQPTDTAPAAAATAEQTPEAFVRSFYLTEQGGTAVRNEDPDAPEVEEPTIWSARTGGLIAETEALGNPGEYAYFEANPICACQDDGGMMLRTVTVTPTGADRADATVLLEWTLAQPVSTVRQTFNLVREGEGWKIDDIQHDQTQEFPQPPLVQDMTRWIAERRAENAAGAN
ncbi:DUF3828 domain-containing protein [Brevundimonas sp. TWP2-3-4b1]|uniref:DUF3828 domain-containing protein n=1 Tax=Brevundimonas sp. TWP2-3-4b1 TaxID=2804580 RepID=UPI003CEA3EFF